MSETQNIFAKNIVYHIAEMDNIIIKHDLSYLDNDELTMDVYYPENRKAEAPVVILVTGYPDPGFKAFSGYKLKEVAQYQSWAKLFAASGLVAITYSNTDPVNDIQKLLEFIEKNHSELKIDKNKIGIWACSGNSPNAVNVLLSEQKSNIKCGVLCYGYMPDSDGVTFTADAARQFHFANPVVKIPVNTLDIPVLIVRAGKDEMPNLNASIDKFVMNALSSQLPISILNIPDASHAFDILNDEEYSYKAIKNIISFMKINLE